MKLIVDQSLAKYSKYIKYVDLISEEKSKQ